MNKQKDISKEKLGNLTQEELELLQKLLQKIGDKKAE
jgi:DNA replication initiation complex subunit (GINS family)